MEFIIVALVVWLVILYNSNKKNKQKVTLLENNFSELKNKYKKLQSELENNTIHIENKRSSKSNSNNPFGYTQEELISFSEKKIEKQYLYPKKDLEDKSHFFYSKKVVITGDFEHFEDRNEIAKLLWEVGADVDTGVGKNTNALVVGENPGPSKMMLAEDMGIDFITENEFRELFELV